jgi:hypothetical protein
MRVVRLAILVLFSACAAATRPAAAAEGTERGSREDATAAPLLPTGAVPPQLDDVRDATAAWQPGDGVRLAIVTNAQRHYAWATIPAPVGGFALGRRERVEADLVNRGATAVEAHVWVVADRGWESVGDFARLEPGATRTFSCRLRETFPDGTPKLDPTRITGVRLILVRPPVGATVELAGLRAAGVAPPFVRAPGRIETPPVEEGPPAAGRRVRHRLAIDAGTRIHSLLHLPDDWVAERERRFPVIVECPGNIFFVAGCYSTGRPEQCAIGHGIARGRGAIWVSVPFVDRTTGEIAENGWGDPDDTADYLVRVVADVCDRFGGDRRNVLLTGFSRGAIACGFIGLRNDRVAAVWKGFHCCQHFDGDGWNGATLAGAIERAARFRGGAVFHTDNDAAAVAPVTDALGVPTTFVSSGLGAHAVAMFLDDRESTRRLRAWFADLVSAPGP